MNEKLLASEESLRRSSYCAHINLAHSNWEDAQVGSVLDLLEGERPRTPGEPDLGGFECYYLERLCRSEHEDRARAQDAHGARG
jgi:hypothetical protein